MEEKPMHSPAEGRISALRAYAPRALAIALVVAVACSGAAIAAKPSKGTFKVTSKMDGRKVISADSDGTGNATIKFKKSKQRACFDISFSRIQEPNRGFIGEGSKGQEGNNVVTLFSSLERSPVSDCVKGVSKKELKDIESHPKDFFVALSNNEFPKGAIRGQLRHKAK
jgi:CHRD domain-containing protein